MDCHPYVTNVAKLINEIGQQDGKVSRVVAKQAASISDASCKKVSTAFPHQCCFHRSKCDFGNTSSDKTKRKKSYWKFSIKRYESFKKKTKKRKLWRCKSFENAESRKKCVNFVDTGEYWWMYRNIFQPKLHHVDEKRWQKIIKTRKQFWNFTIYRKI